LPLLTATMPLALTFIAMVSILLFVSSNLSSDQRGTATVSCAGEGLCFGQFSEEY
jgi:hypothetical protein